jgi:cytochrome c553
LKLRESIVVRSILAGGIIPFAAMIVALVLLSVSAYAQDAAMSYKIYCSRCHGDSGRGDGADAGTLKTHPRNFGDCATMSRISDDTMFKAIKEGGAAVGLPDDMPSWAAGLGDDDIHALMKYVRHFCTK